MTARRKSKVKKLRGSRTHKWGHKKRHRKSGSRGGFGKAGSGKRAQHKKMYYSQLSGGQYLGKSGFHSIRKKKVKTINLDYLNKNFDNLAVKEKDVFVLDCSKFKVLGNGNLKINKKIKIICKSISKKAEDKIKKIGGELVKC
jgi:large subunit ribosomal protein L15